MRTQRRPADITAAVTVHATTLGQLVLAATDEALLLCAYDAPAAARQRMDRAGIRQIEAGDASPSQTRVLDQARAEIDAYLDGKRRNFTVPVDLRLATPFSRQAVQALDAFVPYGTTATYAQLASALDRPRAARAVGAALGANPLCVVLPCHRIVGASGALTGYAGGLAAKHLLLDLEAAAVPDGAPSLRPVGAGRIAPGPAPTDPSPLRKKST